MKATAKRWERVRTHTRTCILEAAAQAFEASGYDDTCMHRIAETAGYTKATIYAHYRDKAHLFAAVMDLHASGFPPVLVPSHPRSDPKEALAYVALEIQKLSQLTACRRFCETVRRSGRGMTFYAELWNAYLAPYGVYICRALIREGIDLEEEYADLYLQLLLQANALHVTPLAATSASATLSLFRRTFEGPSARG